MATVEASLGHVDTELKRLEHEAIGWLERLHDALDGELAELVRGFARDSEGIAVGGRCLGSACRPRGVPAT